MTATTVNRIATAIIVVIVVIVGGVVTLLHPATLPFDDYLRSVGIATGLLAVGYGIDQHSKP